jgi:hypothetical protein
MSKKDIETILPPGKSLEDCDGKCDVAIGRLLQADIIISSRLSQGFGKYFVHISVVDTKTSEILNKEIISAKSLELLLIKTNNFNLEIKRKVKSYTLNTGLLTISTAPPSEIFVDGKSIGNTPVVSAKLEEGSHMIEMFTLKDRKRYVNTVNIKSGKETLKKFFLESKKSLGSRSKPRTRSSSYRSSKRAHIRRRTSRNHPYYKSDKSSASKLLVNLKRDSSKPERPNKNQIRSVMKKVNIRKCKNLDPSRSGKIKIQTVIQNTGRVSKTSIATRSFKGTAVGRCLASQVKRLTFPGFQKSSISFKYPFSL